MRYVLSDRIITHVQLLGGEWPSSNTGGVSLDDTDGSAYHLRRNTEPRAHAANGGRRRSDEWVRPKIDVEHQCIGPFHQDSLSGRNRLVNIGDAVDHVGTQFVGKLLVPQDLAFSVVFEITIALESAFNELPKLGREGFVEEVVDAQARSRSLSRVSRTNSPLGGADAGLCIDIGWNHRKWRGTLGAHLDPPNSTSFKPSTIWWKSNTS